MILKISSKTQIFTLLLLILLFILCSCSSTDNFKNLKAIKGNLNLDNLDFKNNKEVELVGEWEFYDKELLTPKDFKEMNNFKYNNVVEKNGYFHLNGYGTYRLKVNLKSFEEIYCLEYKYSTFEDFVIWIDDKIIRSRNKPKELEFENTLKRDVLLLDDVFFSTKKDSFYITIQVASKKMQNIDKIILTTQENILKKRESKVIKDYLIYGFLIYAGIYNIILHLFRRKDKHKLYLGLACIIALAVIMFGNGRSALTYSSIENNFTYYLVNNISPYFFIVLHDFTAISSITMLSFSLNYFYSDNLYKVTKYISIITIIFWLLFAITSYIDFNKIGYYFYLLNLFGLVSIIIFILTISAIALKFKNFKYIILFIGTVSFVITAINDVLLYSGFKTITLVSYGISILFICESFVISHSFTQAFFYTEKFSKELEKTFSKLKTLLDNSKQGFMTFDKSFLIDDEFSKECINIFNENIKGKSIIELVYFNDSIFIENVLKDIFTISDKAKIKTYFSFLPNVINIKNKFVNIEYKLILEQNEEKKIMLMLTDITEKKKLEKKIESEQNILKMVVKAVVNNSDFNEIINDYKYFCTIKLDNILNSKKNVSEKTSEIFLNIHTFKGNFSQLDMDNTVNKLHNLESKLIELEKNTDVLNDEKLRKLLFYQNLNNWVNKDINILKNVLGENYFKSTNRIIITEENLNEIEDRILTMMSPKEYETFLPEIKLLRKKSFKNILVKYSNYVLQLANRQEKLIHNFEIEGSDFLIETNKYHNFVNSLVNVFRNAVVHGIELPDERLENGKSEYGTIKCTVKNNKNEIIIEISDDGKGLDIEKIKEQILKREYLNKNQLTNLSDKNIIEYIFTDKFTTQKKVNDLSGRGAGLTAVKSEIDILGGEISIETNLNKGTKFTFIIPHNRKDFSKELFIKNTILSLICEIENYFINTFNSKMLSINYDNLFSSNEIFSRENNVYINFKSIVNGRIIMSVNDSTAKKIIRANLIEKLDPSEEKELLFDALAECANVIIGKALEMSVGINNRVKISSPSIIAAKTAVEIKHVKADTKSINIVFKEGTISLTCIIATLFDI